MVTTGPRQGQARHGAEDRRREPRAGRGRQPGEEAPAPESDEGHHRRHRRQGDAAAHLERGALQPADARKPTASASASWRTGAGRAISNPTAKWSTYEPGEDGQGRQAGRRKPRARRRTGSREGRQGAQGSLSAARRPPAGRRRGSAQREAPRERKPVAAGAGSAAARSTTATRW